MPPLSLNLIFVLTSYILGLIIGYFLDLNIYILFSLFLFSSMFLFVFINRSVVSLIAFLIFIFLGTINIEIDNLKRGAVSGLKSFKEVEVEGVVKSIPIKRGKEMRFALYLQKINSDDVSNIGDVMVRSKYDYLIEPGDLIFLRGLLKSYRNNNYFVSDYIIKKDEQFSFKRYIYRIKKYASLAIDELYFKEYSRFIKASVLGEIDSDLKNLRDVFQEVGVVHIIAISGLHVGLLLFFFGFLLKVLGVYGKIRMIILISILIFYMLLSGCRPPVMRATIMAIVYLYFWFKGYKVNPFNILMTAAFTILILEPKALFGLSFQLSFAAILGIFTMLHLFDYGAQSSGFKNKFLSYIKVTSGAYIAVLPLIWFYFNKISLVAVFVNVISIFIFSYLIGSSFFALIIFPLIPPVSRIITCSNMPIFYYLFKALDSIAALPFASLNMPNINIAGVAFIYLIFILIVLSIRDTIKKRGELSSWS